MKLAGGVRVPPSRDGASRSSRGLGALSFHASTPYGDVVISGDGNDRHEGPALLLIDTGGDDTYVGGSDGNGGRPASSGSAAASGPEAGVSVLIDLGGNDSYRPARWTRSAPGPSAGAGVLGYGYLIDLAGDDTYEGSCITEGAGLFGVGL